MSTVKAINFQHPSASTAAVTLAADGSMTGAFPAPNRNLLYNGAMQVAQRGTSTASVTTTGYYTADRWQFVGGGLGTWTQTEENDAPTGSGLRKSLKLLATTADASPAASDIGAVRQNLEGRDVQRIAKGTSSAQQVTASFWVKSNLTGTFIAYLYDWDNTRSISAAYTISASNTWERKTVTFAADTLGALDNDSECSLSLVFGLGAGSDFTAGTLNTSWATTTTSLLTGQTNVAAATNNYWQITGVQLEVGPVATGFEFKSFGQELAECQRYYQKSYAQASAPGTVTDDGAVIYDNVGGGTRVSLRFPCEMRGLPVVTFYNPVSGASGSTRNVTAGSNVNTAAAMVVGSSGFGFDSGVIAVGAIGTFHYTASAEL